MTTPNPRSGVSIEPGVVHYWLLAGPWRGRYNRRNMQDTLRRLKELAEAG